MATLEHIDFVPTRYLLESKQIKSMPVKGGKVTTGLPQIIWESGRPWMEACLWAHERLISVDIQTVQGDMRHLHAYAVFLEEIEQDWRHFPIRKADRVLVLWRGELIKKRERGMLSSSTVTQRMNATINFYRYAAENNMVGNETPLWQERHVAVPYFDRVGFARTMNVLTTDISIPNRRRHGTLLEDGVLPLSSKHMQQLLDFTQTLSNIELGLLIKLGFLTGARIGTLATLRIATVERSIQDPNVPSLYRFAVGPTAKPPVDTKFDVEGHILVPDALVELLRTYMYSPRRLKRETRAAKGNKDLIFLTRNGNSYVERSANKSPAINQAIADLRNRSTRAGLRFMHDFKFHQTRATFGTRLMEESLRAGDPVTAVGFVRDTMLHKHESTTFKYIKFLNEAKAKEAAARAFSVAFTGTKKKLDLTPKDTPKTKTESKTRPARGSNGDKKTS